MNMERGDGCGANGSAWLVQRPFRRREVDWTSGLASGSWLECNVIGGWGWWVPTTRRGCYEQLREYFLWHRQAKGGRLISVTGHSHYEAYAAEWGASVVGLEVGENNWRRRCGEASGCCCIGGMWRR